MWFCLCVLSIRHFSRPGFIVYPRYVFAAGELGSIISCPQTTTCTVLADKRRPVFLYLFLFIILPAAVVCKMVARNTAS